MNNIIVIGGAGYIGSRLVHALVAKGYHTTAIDVITSEKAVNLHPHIDNNSIDYIQGDILDINFIQQVISANDYIFLLAMIPQPHNPENPVSFHEMNTKAVLNVLEAARLKKANKIIYTSSCAVYGNNPKTPISEDELAAPESHYALAKLIGEYYCSAYSKIYNIPTVCLRLFNVYGPHQNPESPMASVITKLLARIINGQPPIIYGDGAQIRDFVHVDDVIQALILSINDEVQGVFNIGSGEGTTLNKLLELLLDVTDSTLSPLYKSTRRGEIEHSVADISKFLKFGYNPSVQIEEGVNCIVRIHESNNN